jgi:hypothetical protein
MRAWHGFVLCMSLLVGCSGGEGKAKSVPLDQVPDQLVKKAQETLPDVKFDSARIRPNGDYEVRGKNAQGKVREVEMTPDGKVVEIE